MAQHIVGGTDLDHAAEIHDAHDDADVADDGEVVPDEQVGEAESLLHLAQQHQDLRADGHVERGDRLVEHEEARLHRQRSRDRDPLALAAAELMRIAVAGVLAESDRLEQAAPLPRRWLRDPRAAPTTARR